MKYFRAATFSSIFTNKSQGWGKKLPTQDGLMATILFNRKTLVIILLRFTVVLVVFHISQIAVRLAKSGWSAGKDFHESPHLVIILFAHCSCLLVFNFPNCCKKLPNRWSTATTSHESQDLVIILLRFTVVAFAVFRLLPKLLPCRFQIRMVRWQRLLFNRKSLVIILLRFTVVALLFSTFPKLP